MRTECRWLLTLLVFVAVLAPPAVGPPTRPPRARLVMDAVKRTVESAGLTLDDLVSRAFIGSDKLPRGAHFEVQGVATRKPR